LCSLDVPSCDEQQAGYDDTEGEDEGSQLFWL
jgi:hypothetical protein